MRLVDAHAHLQAEPFRADAATVLDEARRIGVERLLAPGWDLSSSRAGVALARTSGIDASAGIHPHVAAADDATWQAVAELAGDPHVVAIGETGLDHDRAFSAHEAQLTNLRRHLALARATGKPLILHCRSRAGERDAQDGLLRELRDAGLGSDAWGAAFGGRPPAVLHSFSGPVDYAEEALALGLAISFSGLVFRRGEEASATVARLVPRDRLLVETDAPYLSPPGAPRRRNEPAWVAVTARWLAAQRGDDPLELGDALVANYDAVFSRPPRALDQSPPRRETPRVRPPR